MTLMYRDENVIREQLEKFFQTMVEIAKADDIITDDERKILNEIQRGIDNLEDQLIQILQSELDEEEFRDLEAQILQDIVYNTIKVAKEDDVITEDEDHLITKLREFAERGVIE